MRYLKVATVVLIMAVGQAGAIEYGLMKNEFGLDGGTTQGTSGNDFKDVVDKGTVFGFHYTHFMNPSLGFGFQFDYFKFLDQDINTIQSFFDSNTGFYSDEIISAKSEFSDLSIMPTCRLNILRRGLVIPYLSSGLGLHRLTLESQLYEQIYTNLPGLTDSTISTSDKKSKTNVCGMLALGIDVMISEVCRIGIEGRYNYYKQNLIENAGDLEMLMLKGRMSWYFN